VCPEPDEACKHRTECVVYAAGQEEAGSGERAKLEAERESLERQIAAREASRPGHDSGGGRHAMRLFALRERLDEVRVELERLSGA
jgi:hypothetical protein